MTTYSNADANTGAAGGSKDGIWHSADLNGKSTWNSNFQSAQVLHYLFQTSGWNLTSSLYLWQTAGSKYQSIEMVNGNNTQLTTYHETANDGDNRPVWTLPTAVLNGVPHLISVYRFASGGLWVCQNGIVCDFSGSWNSGQNADGAVNATDHLTGCGFPGTSNTEDLGLGSSLSDGASWLSSELPAETAVAIAADAAAFLASWRITSR